MTYRFATIIVILVCVAVGAAQRTDSAVVGTEAVHQVLFESGFYSQALEYIDSRTATADSAQVEELLRYRAFSLIMLGRRDSAVGTFGAIITRNPSFVLDPIYTSPKIYEVYYEAKQQVDAMRSDSTALRDTVTRQGSVVDTIAPRSVPDTVRESAHIRDSRPYRPLYLLPFGVGQFHNRQAAKGVLVAVSQALALGASIFTYARRDDYYDPRFGWYEGNAQTYENATNAYRIEFCVFAASWLYSVIDAFVVDSRNQRRTSKSRVRSNQR